MCGCANSEAVSSHSLQEMSHVLKAAEWLVVA